MSNVLKLKVSTAFFCALLFASASEAQKKKAELPSCTTAFDNCRGSGGWQEKVEGSRIYEGEWKKGKPDGFGRLSDYSKGVRYVGFFKEGELKGPYIAYKIITSTWSQQIEMGERKRKLNLRSLEFEEVFSPLPLKQESFPYNDEDSISIDLADFVLRGVGVEEYVDINGDRKFKLSKDSDIICFSAQSSTTSRAFFRRKNRPLPPDGELIKAAEGYLNRNLNKLFDKSLKPIHLRDGKCSGIPTVYILPAIDQFDANKRKFLSGQFRQRSELGVDIKKISYNDIVKESPSIKENSEISDNDKYLYKRYPALGVDKGFIGSLIFADRFDFQKYPILMRPCTTALMIPNKYAVDGYLHALKYETILKGAPANWVNAFGYQLADTKWYSSLDKFVIALQNGSAGDCNIFIDTAENVAKVERFLKSPSLTNNFGTIERNADISFSRSLYFFIDGLKLRGVFTSNFGEFEFLYSGDEERRPSRDILLRYGVRDEIELNSIFDEMRAAGYEGERSDNGAIAYIQDKNKASTLPGATALSIRNERIAEQERLAAARQAEKERAAAAQALALKRQDVARFDALLLQGENLIYRAQMALLRGHFCFNTDRYFVDELRRVTTQINSMKSYGYTATPAQKQKIVKLALKSSSVAGALSSLPTRPYC